MNVVALNGSPRIGRTCELLSQIKALLEPQHQVTILNLADFEVKPCQGCEACIRRTSQCVLPGDESSQIMDQLLNADGIIIGSPSYVMNVSGLLKVFIDKTCWWVHRPQLAGKPFLSVVTTRGSGMSELRKYLSLCAVQWGAQPAGHVGRSATKEGAVTQKELASFLWHLETARERYRPTMYQLYFYQVQRVMASMPNALDIDRAHWQDKPQWFHFPCRIGPLRKAVSWIIYQSLSKVISSVQSRRAALSSGQQSPEP